MHDAALCKCYADDNDETEIAASARCCEQLYCCAVGRRASQTDVQQQRRSFRQLDRSRVRDSKTEAREKERYKSPPNADCRRKGLSDVVGNARHTDALETPLLSCIRIDRDDYDDDDDDD